MGALAWRNLLRARGRSLTTVFTVALVVCLSLLLLSFAAASLDGFIRTLTERGGHVVIRVEGYREKEDLESLSFEAEPLRGTLSLPSGSTGEGVLEGPALLIAGDRSRAAVLVGLEPPGFRRQESYLTRGRLPQRGDEALLGAALARALRVDLGGEVVAYAPGGTGTGIAAFRVVGLLDLPETGQEARTLLVPLSAAQVLLAPGRVTRLEVRLPAHGLYEEEKVQALQEVLRRRLVGFQVETWREANPAMDALIRLYEPILAVYVGIFFGLVGLILLNALYLSFVERIREFGLLAALGASRRRIVGVVLLESGFLVGLGTLVGVLVGIGMYLEMRDGFRLPFGLAERYLEFGFPEVLYGRLTARDFLLTVGYALAVSVLAALWPAHLAGRLEPVEAMRYAP
ncbi:MAG: FtsX-like permease family protein [Armatimonadetes bacterium]|nr:FtsX-like permease family protein [Armatimonadota bacterium]